jgi:hypothetical protein
MMHGQKTIKSCWLVTVKTCTHLKGNIFVRKTSYEPYTKKVALYLQLAEDALTPATQCVLT